MLLKLPETKAHDTGNVSGLPGGRSGVRFPKSLSHPELDDGPTRSGAYVRSHPMPFEDSGY